MNPAPPSEWLDPIVLNLLTGLALLAAGFALGGWLAWRRHRRRPGTGRPASGR